MVVDYERAWIRLTALVASKTQHGREPLLSDMANLAAECQVPEGEPERWLRLFGMDVSRTVRPPAIRDSGPSSDGDSVAGGTGTDPATLAHEGGHDGRTASSNGRQPVGA